MILARQVKISRAKPADAIGVQTLLRETWIDTYVNEEDGISRADIESINFLSEENINRRLNEFQKKITGRFAAVVRIGNDIVGMCSFFITGPVGTIKAIYISPRFQRLGIGSKLFEYAIEHLKDCRIIEIELASQNKKAYSFYFKHGFVENGKSGIYKLPNGKSFPTICMELKKT